VKFDELTYATKFTVKERLFTSESE